MFMFLCPWHYHVQIQSHQLLHGWPSSWHHDLLYALLILSLDVGFGLLVDKRHITLSLLSLQGKGSGVKGGSFLKSVKCPQTPAHFFLFTTLSFPGVSYHNKVYTSAKYILQNKSNTKYFCKSINRLVDWVRTYSSSESINNCTSDKIKLLPFCLPLRRHGFS